MRRDKTTFSNFVHKTLGKTYFKNRVIELKFFQEREYRYTTRGRCISYRSKGKISSIVVRNVAYGTEQRVFINIPRLLVYL
jgi:hypothetical protein